MKIEDQPEDKQPLLNESEVNSFIPQQQTTAAISHDQATAEIQAENTESKNKVYKLKVTFLFNIFIF